MRRLRTIAVPAALAVLGTAGATPARAAAGGVAIFPLQTKGNVGANIKELERALEQQLVSTAREAGIDVVAGRELSQRVRRPAAALDRCQNDATCIAKLGKRAGVAEVLTGRVTAAGGGVRVSLRAINVGRGQITRQVQLDIARRADIASIVSGQVTEIFGVAGEEDLAMPALEDLTLPDDTGTEAEDTEVADSEAAGAAAAGESEDDPTESPDLMPLLALEPPPSESVGTARDDGGTTTRTTGEPETLAASEPRAAPESAGEMSLNPDILPLVPPPSTAVDGGSSVPVLLYGGIAVAAAGAITAGIGGIFGLMRNDAESAAADPAVDQVEAARLRDQGNAHAQTANALYIAGVAVAAAGGVLIGLHAMLDSDDGDPTPEVHLSAGPAAAALRLRF